MNLTSKLTLFVITVAVAAQLANAAPIGNTPAERIRLANEMIDRANEIVIGRRGGTDSLLKSQEALEALTGQKRNEVISLCERAYENGSRQRDSYTAAARALGMIQILDPTKRLDSLLKLQKMYEDVYRTAPSQNVGIAKGLAEVLLQVGDEHRRNLRKNAIQGAAEITEEIAAVSAITSSYTRGLQIIRGAMNAIRPYAAGNKAYQDFLSQSADIEKAILDAQRSMAARSARATELDRSLKLYQTMQRRFTNNPKDAIAADRLVRFYINEFDDPKLLETVLPAASKEVQAAVALLKKNVSDMTAAEAATAAKWCNLANDNPTSPNLIAMGIRTRVYCDAFLQKNKSEDATPIRLILSRITTDLTKAQIDDAQVQELTQSYIAALAPPPPPPPVKPVEVATVPTTPTPPAPTPEPPTITSDPPKVATAQPTSPPPPLPPSPPPPQRQLTRIKVTTPVTTKEEDDTAYERRPTIFDFGRD